MKPVNTEGYCTCCEIPLKISRNARCQQCLELLAASGVVLKRFLFRNFLRSIHNVSSELVLQLMGFHSDFAQVSAIVLIMLIQVYSRAVRYVDLILVLS